MPRDDFDWSTMQVEVAEDEPSFPYHTGTGPRERTRERTPVEWGRQRGGMGTGSYTHGEIADRDGWICQLCHTTVERGCRHPDRWSPSIDHIKPVSAVGTDTRDNVQLTHLGCNLDKNFYDTTTETPEQYAIRCDDRAASYELRGRTDAAARLRRDAARVRACEHRPPYRRGVSCGWCFRRWRWSPEQVRARVARGGTAARKRRTAY
jgi:hypothetical protein